MRLSNRERLQQAKKVKQTVTRLETLDDFIDLMLGGPQNPTQHAFLYDPTEVKAFMGQAGAAKTSTICVAGMLRALFEPGSKGLVGRNDYNDLMDTTVATLEEILSRLPKGILLDRDKSPPMKWWIQPQVPPDHPQYGEISQITFMGLKEAMGSYQFNWAAIDEADEIEQRAFSQVLTRTRLKTGGPRMVVLAYNPPPKTHWLYTAVTGRDAQNRWLQEPTIPKMYVPIPGENKHNLRDNYYEDLLKGLTEDEIQRLVRGEWGSVFSGKPVYSEYKAAWHKRMGLRYDEYRTLYRFWDFGYNNPFCIWAQVDDRGILKALREEAGKMEEIKPFARRCLAITRSEFPGVREFVDFGDPAARQNKDTGSTLSHLMEVGINLRYILGHIEPGLRTVRLLLNRAIGGEPAIQIDEKCVILNEMLKGGYHLDEKGEKPVKDGFYDHPADALRYGVTNLFGLTERNGSAIGDVSNIPGSVEYDPAFDEGV